MSTSPVEVVETWLQNLFVPDVVNRLVAPDATYVSLNTDDRELAKIMPGAGTSQGPQAFLDNLGSMFTRWEIQAFDVTAVFGADENVAVFGDFRYKSHSLGHVVSSPFAIHVKVVNGRVTYLQFLEDSYPPRRASGKAAPGQSRRSRGPNRSRCRDRRSRRTTQPRSADQADNPEEMFNAKR